jgi:DNA-binding NarL/FixJ family response regulator
MAAVTLDGARPIRVLLADDEQLIRAGIRLVLRHAGDIEVVAEASDGREAAELAVRHSVDVALMDIRMPGADGLAATEWIAERAPAVRVLILTTFGNDEYVGRALRAGAAGFLLKDSGPEELIHAVRVVARGQSILSPEITRRLIDRHVARDGARAEAGRGLIATLTGREREVLVMIGTGLSNADIGKRLYLGEGSVKTYVSRVLSKLGCGNRVQAAILAHEAGILSEVAD